MIKNTYNWQRFSQGQAGVVAILTSLCQKIDEAFLPKGL